MSATNEVDRALARSQKSLADEWTSKNVGFAKRSELVAPKAAPLVDRRSTDEIVSLYANSILYGIGTGLWVATLSRPDTIAAGVIPTVVLTAGSVGTVMALDSTSFFRYGVPQSIVSGMWLGLEQGIIWTWFQSEVVNRRQRETAVFTGDDHLSPAAISSIIWGASTGGAVLGGLLGSKLETTPGRSAWVGSTGLWTGTLFGCFVGAATLSSDFSSDGSAALATTGVAGVVGTGIGMLTAGHVSPSISRVRYIDLAALLAGAGTFTTYALAAERASSQAAAGITGLGVTAGLIIGWVATTGIPKDMPRSSPPPQPTSALARLRPSIAPSPSYQGGGSGAIIGVGGSLD